MENNDIGHLLWAYRRSPEYQRLKPKTKQCYERAFNQLQPFDTLPVPDLRRRALLTLRDEMLDRPATANNFIAAIRVLMDFAVDREYREDNPALRIKALPTGEWKAWPKEKLKLFEKHSTGMARRMFMLGLYTGQRRGDVLRMQWGRCDTKFIHVVQEKTGAEVYIPVAPPLKDEIISWWKDKPKGIYWLHDEKGQPLTSTNFERIWRKERERLGCLDMTFHGLRKSAASRLAEAGCTDREIMSITGHKSVAMVSHYTKQADQRRRAVSAMSKLEKYNAG